MTKTFYYAVSEKNEQGKNYAFTITATENDNLLSIFARYRNLAYINACKTKKQATELADFWNDCYIANGTYLFDEDYLKKI
jgi:hypothetical protein